MSRKSSFRGVPFHVESHEFTTGRKSEVHEFPDRETPYSEDLGKSAESFSLSIYVIGEDHEEQRDKLLEALTKEGPGDLIHPELGKKFVQVGSVSLSGNKDSRISKMSVEFTEAGELLFPSDIIDKDAALDSAAVNALNESKKEFDTFHSIVSAPGHIVDAARKGIDDSTEAMEKATKFIAKIADAGAEFAYSVSDLRAKSQALLNYPDKLSKRIQDSLAMIRGLSDDSDSQALSLKNLYNYGKEIFLPSSTSSRKTEKNNNDQLNNLMRRTAIINGCLVAADTNFKSTADAIEKMSELDAHLDDQASKTSQDSVYQALKDLSAAMSSVLLDNTNNYKNIVEYTPPSTLPSLVIVHELFENPDLENDLIERNDIVHPGFIQGGVELEIVNE